MKLTVDFVMQLSEHKQISDIVEQITENTDEYTKTGNLEILEMLKDICIKENMTVEMAKMYRNIGMYHFHANNFNEAIISMQFAVDILRREDYTSLLVEYYSEMGFIYFFNREYIYARRYYEEAEELLIYTDNIERRILYLHYCRYGVLLSNMQEYALSRLKLEKALLYADDDKDTGFVIMNIGLLYKRQKDMKTALRYYSKALCLLDENSIKTKGAVYNNIAEVYKIFGQYDKALSYIDKAFKCITDNDYSKWFIFFNTYTEIKILMGERESVLDEFLKLLGSVKDFHLYKSLIIEGISNMIIVCSEDRNMLKKLEAVIIKLLEESSYENEEYKKELKVCLGNIRLCLKEL